MPQRVINDLRGIALPAGMMGLRRHDMALKPNYSNDFLKKLEYIIFLVIPTTGGILNFQRFLHKVEMTKNRRQDCHPNDRIVIPTTGLSSRRQDCHPDDRRDLEFSKISP
jgi:hypothetical protein